jgi:hypothetical protein
MSALETGNSMIFRDETARTPRVCHIGDLLSVLAILGVRVLAVSWMRPAMSADKAPDVRAAARQLADSETAVGGAVGEAVSSFGLPPIVVKVREPGDTQDRTITFKADLVFDEVDQNRIDDSMSVSKRLLPRIMDSVITGLDGKRIENLSDPATVTAMVVERANLVLTPYGVVVKALKMQYLGWR